MFLLCVAFAAVYGVLNLWLPSVAKKDMDRRDQPGWAYDVAVWWCLPVGLLSWWAARRRYPIVERPRR